MDMVELQPEEVQHLNAGVPPPATTAAEAPTAATASAIVSGGSKRQRRPSVRLGEIGGDQFHHVSYDSHVRRTSKWRPPASRKDPNPAGKPSKTRTLTNLSSGYENIETLNDEREGTVDSTTIRGWRVNKRVGSSAAAATATATATATTTRRVRSNWALKTDETRNKIDHGDEKFSGGEELEDGFHDFSREDSESPMKEQQSPVNSPGNHNERDDFYNRRRYNNNNCSRTRFSESREFELSEPSDMDGGGWRSRGREAVRIWLEGLGLGRYWPVFELHEVDDEVLPLLTLEDLKDMGINAVGSRRKMYCAIQKLGKEFS